MEIWMEKASGTLKSLVMLATIWLSVALVESWFHCNTTLSIMTMLTNDKMIFGFMQSIIILSSSISIFAFGQLSKNRYLIFTAAILIYQASLFSMIMPSLDTQMRIQSQLLLTLISLTLYFAIFSLEAIQQCKKMIFDFTSMLFMMFILLSIIFTTFAIFQYGNIISISICDSDLVYRFSKSFIPAFGSWSMIYLITEKNGIKYRYSIKITHICSLIIIYISATMQINQHLTNASRILFILTSMLLMLKIYQNTARYDFPARFLLFAAFIAIFEQCESLCYINKISLQKDTQFLQIVCSLLTCCAAIYWIIPKLWSKPGIFSDKMMRYHLLCFLIASISHISTYFTSSFSWHTKYLRYIHPIETLSFSLGMLLMLWNIWLTITSESDRGPFQKIKPTAV